MNCWPVHAGFLSFFIHTCNFLNLRSLLVIPISLKFCYIVLQASKFPVASMATQIASTTYSSPSYSSWKYDVFLSFCGDDTCKNFRDHLYATLKQKCIITFMDDEKLERGKYISQELLKAIEESKYAIVVLSKNYASSRCGAWLN